MIDQPLDKASRSLIFTNETNPLRLANEYGYGPAQAEGFKWQKWLDGPIDSSCPVLPIRLSIRMLSLNYGWCIFDGDYPPDAQTASRHYPPGNLGFALKWHDLPTGRKYTRVILGQQRHSSGGTTENEYLLQTGPGAIFALESKRTDGPYWSDIALATYRFYETEDLRFVFRVNVINPLTTAIVGEVYFWNSRRWPDRRHSYWMHGTPEYQAILSTPNAKGVAALVLGDTSEGLDGYLPS